MILGSLKNTETAEKVHYLFKKAFDYIKTVDLTTIPSDGTSIELERNKLYLFTNEYLGKTRQDVIGEAHRKYIDIQVIIEGTESMGWIELSECRKLFKPYDSEKDVVLYNDAPSSYIQVSPGEFVIFFPEDVHAPGIGTQNIKKLVVKALI